MPLVMVHGSLDGDRSMGTGIIICGLNGAGKSTLGQALAKELGFCFIDIEDLYFPKRDSDYLYASPCARKEVEALLESEIHAHEDFVFASVHGDYGESICLYFRYAVLISLPKNVRMERIRNRSFQKFGDRMLPGGDLYEQEQKFFDFACSRAENSVEEWAASLSCPVIRVDGTKSAAENIKSIIAQIHSEEN